MVNPKNNVTQLVQELVQPFLDEEAFELVDIEYVKEGQNWFLRIYVDKENGIEIEDCGRISEYLSGKLDETDPIPDAYFLEVSSPGAERPLKKPSDFEKSIGQNVFLTTYEQIKGQKDFEGKLLAFNEEILTIQLGKKQVDIPIDRIANARLAVTF